MRIEMFHTVKVLILTALIHSAALGADAPGTSTLQPTGAMPAKEELRRMQAACDYRAIVEAYVNHMIQSGRDRYGKIQSPLFVSVMDRKTGKVFQGLKHFPYPHVITRPFAPGLRRDHKMRPYDRTYSGGNPLEDLPLYELLYRLSELSGDTRFAREADASIAWFLDNAQSPVTGLYAWGSHMYWDVYRDLPIYAETGSPNGGYGGHEYLYVWPYWEGHAEALRKFAHGLWKNQIADQKSGRFSRHAGYEKRSVAVGFEFPQTGACYIDIWAREYGRSGDPEMKLAIETLLKLYRSMRDPKTGAMSWCTADGGDRREVTCVPLNLFMANTVQDAAMFVESRDKDLAGQMRAFAREVDDEYLSNDYDKILDVDGKGILIWYTLADRQPMPRDMHVPPPGFENAAIGYPLKTSDGMSAASLSYLAPWFVNRSYAEVALLLLGRCQRSDEQYKPLYRRAVVETADVYMTLEPEVQFVIYPDDLAYVVKLLREVFRLTDNPAYLHRADRMMKLAVRLLFDDVSPLPKISHFDDWYESSLKNGSSVEILRQMLELSLDLAAMSPEQRKVQELQTGVEWVVPGNLGAGQDSAPIFEGDFRKASAAGLARLWDGKGLSRESRDVVLRYGSRDDRGLYLSLSEGSFTTNGMNGPVWNIGFSDVINHIPSAAEADAINGRPNEFTGKRMAASHIEDAGFKDVVKQVAVVIRNGSDVPCEISVSATLHDTYHDNGVAKCIHRLNPGEQGLFVLGAGSSKWIRRLMISGDRNQASLQVQQVAFILAPRNQL